MLRDFLLNFKNQSEVDYIIIKLYQLPIKITVYQQEVHSRYHLPSSKQLFLQDTKKYQFMMKQQDPLKHKPKRTFLSFFFDYEQIERESQNIQMDQLYGILKENKQSNIEQEKTISSQNLQGLTKKDRKDEQKHDLSSLKQNANRFDAKQVQSKRIQTESISPQIVRKSRRLHEKQTQKLSFTHCTGALTKTSKQQQPHKNYISMIKVNDKKLRSQQTSQFHRPLIERLKNPGNATLRQTKVTFKQKQFYYSIDVKYKQNCEKHQPGRKQPVGHSSAKQDNMKLQSEIKKCPFCKKVGTYWFSAKQLLKFNNGNYVRRYLQSFI